MLLLVIQKNIIPAIACTILLSIAVSGATAYITATKIIAEIIIANIKLIPICDNAPPKTNKTFTP